MFHETQNTDRPDGWQRPRGLGRLLVKVTVPATADAPGLIPDGGSPGVGHSVWLRPAAGACAPVANETHLPVWAAERITAQFLPDGGELGICHGPGPARTDLDVIASDWAPDWMNNGQIYGGTDRIRGLDAALVLADPCDYEQALALDVAARFFRVLREAVIPGGVVLVHTHQASGPGGLLDPTGTYVRAARAAGLGYLQHHVIVLGRLLIEPLSARDHAPRNAPQGKAQPRHRRVHSDLLAFIVPLTVPTKEAA